MMDSIKRTSNIHLLYRKTKVLQALRSKGKITKLFKEFDADGNGQIDLNEFKNGLRSCGCILEPHEYSFMFNSIDGNSSGDIDIQEFSKFLAVAPKKKMRAMHGRRRSSQLVRVGLRNDPSAEIKSVASSSQATQRTLELRRAGVRDFSDFRIFHAISGVRSAFSKAVRLLSQPEEPRR
jgi:hypothetical protein